MLNALAFDAKNLSTINTIEFVIKLCKQIIIFGVEFSDALKQSLKDCATMGKHTNVVHFGAGFVRKYLWAQKDHQPWGTKLALQCQQCGGLKPWIVAYFQPNKVYMVKCGNTQCGKVDGRGREAVEFSVPFPAGASSSWIKVEEGACWLEVLIMD